MSFGSRLVGVRARVLTLSALVMVAAVGVAPGAHAQVLIQNLFPPRNAHTVAPDVDILVTYYSDIDNSTVDEFSMPAYSTYRGKVFASYGGTGPTITLTPNFQFLPGERIWATVTPSILGATDGTPGQPYTWRFTTSVLGGSTLFDSMQTLGTSLSYGVALGDLDGDDDLDAFVASSNSDHVVYLNNGSGTLTLMMPALSNTAKGTGVALGDLNGDGLLDAVVSVAEGSNQIWMNSGSGFVGSTFGGAEKSTGVAIADLDNDGDLDVFITNDETLLYGNHIWRNDGAGVLTQASGPCGPDLGSCMPVFSGASCAQKCPGNPYDRSDSVALGDIDSDGWVDVVVAELDKSATVWRNTVGDFWSATNPTAQSFTASQGQGVALGDLDGDGDLDLFLARGGLSSRSNQVWLNSGAGVFTNTLQNLGSQDSYDVKLVDIDGDGDLDAVVANSDFTAATSANAVWINNGTANFGLAPSQTMLGTGKNYEQTYGLDLGDLDGDGDLDAFFANTGVAPFNTDGVWFNNTSPVLAANLGLTLNEGAAATITAARLAATDADDGAVTLTYSLTQATVNGSVERDGVVLGVGSQFTQGDINSGLVIYRHSGSETSSDQFKFRVADPRGAQTAEHTFALTINPVNDAPAVTVNQGATVVEASSVVITNTMLRAVDADHPLATSLTFRVTTLPARGQVRRQGSPTTSFTQDDINNSRITYLHDGSEQTTDSFGFSVEDSAVPPAVVSGQVFNITVTPVNDAPTVGGTLSDTVNEGATRPLTSSLLSASDPDNTPAQLTFVISTLPVNGTLIRSGVPLTAGSNTFTYQDVLSNLISYAHGGSETTSDSFVFYVRDTGSPVGQTSSATFSFVVNPQNDPPTISANTGLSGVTEGGNAIIGNNRLQATDPDNTVDQLTFTLTDAPDNGALRIGTTPILVNGTFTQVDINANAINYQHDGSQTTSDSFRFRVSDGAGGQTAEAVFAITVAAVNNAPSVTTNNGLTLAEGATGAITSARLAATDPDDSDPALVYTLITAPSHGTLRNVTTTIGAGGTFTQADLDAGTLITYEHNGSETTLDSFRFVVRDPGGLSSPAETFVITVTAVNDLPRIVANAGLSLAEGATATISASLLRATDDDNDDAALVYRVAQIPAYGTLRRDGTAVAASGTFTQGDIDTGKVTYVHNGTENFADAFFFTVSDGTATTPSQTFAIAITPVNDAPVVVANGGLVVNEGASAVITDAVLAASDVDHLVSSLTYVVLQAPINGVLRNGTTALVSNSTFTQGNINAGNINYLHNGSETVVDSFQFVVRDAIGASAPAETFDITILPVNDPPAIARNQGLTVAEGATAPVLNSQLQATDNDHPASALVYRLTVVPAHGALTLAGAPLVENATFTQDDVDDGILAYGHDGGESTSDSFRFIVSDGTAQTTERTFALTITPVNDVPEIAVNAGLSVLEGAQNAPITPALLRATDPDANEASLRFTVLVLPTKGTLSLGGTPILVNGSFLQSDLQSSLVTYSNSQVLPTTDTFRFTVTDGTATSAQANFNITIDNNNDAPTITVSGPATVAEGGAVTLDSTLLAADDVDGDPAGLVFTVTAAPLNGALYNNILPLGPGAVFSQDQINRGRIRYVHGGGENTSDQFSFSVTDAGGLSVLGDFDLTVTPVNDLPVVTVNNVLNLNEGATVQLTPALLAATDAEAVPGNAGLVFRVVGLPAHGQLTVGGAPLALNGTFTQANLQNPSAVRYVHDSSETTDDAFSFVVTDGTDVTPTQFFAITINPINDAPVVARNVIAYVTEGQSVVIDNGALRATDSDDDDALLLFTLTAAPAHGELRLNNVPLATSNTFTQGDINSGSLAYHNDGGEAGNDTFSFRVSDGRLLTPTSGSVVFNITVRPVNDAPVIAANTGATVTAGQTVTITSTMLRAQDADDDDAALVYTITQVPQHGRLRNNITTVQAGQRVLQADIDANRLVYIHNGDEATGDSFAFRLRDPNNYELVEMSFAITIQGVNDSPVIVQNAGQTIEEGASFTLNATLLRATDPDSAVASLIYTLQVPPAHGTLSRSGVALTANGTFAQADVDGGLLAYQHDGSETTADAFTVVVADNLGASSAPAVFAITVNPVNDVPTLTNNGLSVNEGSRAVIQAAALSASDPDSDVPSLVFTLVTAPAHGTLFAGLAPVTASNAFSQSTITNGSLAYQHDGGEDASDSFVFRVRDSGNAETVDTTFVITILPVNDPPVLGTIPGQTIQTGAAFATFDLDAFVTDVDNALTDLTWSASGNSNLNVTISADNVVTVVEASAGWTGSETITFAVSDGTDSVDTTAIFTVTALPNRPPVFVEPTPEGTVTVEVGRDLVFSVVAEDPDGDTLSYRMQGLPIGATFNTTTGDFAWAPMVQHIGAWNVTLYAEDLEFTVSRPLIIEVVPAPVVDAGTPDAGPPVEEGCGCSAPGQRAPGLFALLAVLGLVLRRRRAR